MPQIYAWVYVYQCAKDQGSLRWRHNDRAGVSNHQPHGCLLNRLFRRKSKKTSKLRVTGFCAGNSPGTGEFPAQMASYTENVSIWWRHHDDYIWYVFFFCFFFLISAKNIFSSLLGIAIVFWVVVAATDCSRESTFDHRWFSGHILKKI